MKRRLLAGILAAALVTAIPSCTVDPNAGSPEQSAQASKDGPIVIGLATARSGWMAAYDIPAERGAEMAADKINAEGGVAGRQLVLKTLDTKTDQQTSRTATQELISQGAAIIVASGDFDQGSPSALAAQEKGVIAISAGAGSPRFGVQGIGPMAFTMGSPTPNEAATAADWAKTRGWTKGALLCDESIEYSLSLCDYWEAAMKMAGSTVAIRQNFQQNDSSIAQQVAAIKNAGADYIYLPSYLPGGAAAIRQIRAAGIQLPIVTSQAIEGAGWIDSVQGLSDVYMTVDGWVGGPGDTQQIVDFNKEYAQRYGEIPPAAIALVGYATIEVLAAALEKTDGDTTGSVLAEALGNLTHTPTIIGPITFTQDKHWSQERQMAVLQIQNGQVSFIERFTATNVPDAGV